ncbi:MAG: hypothetical protein CFE32_02200 [Alphaproteobacteria bacterium PA3]|nr:MAG: hypothetical protein CFE32_02200 [Alphaproteobacteria bacterium PA3]
MKVDKNLVAMSGLILVAAIVVLFAIVLSDVRNRALLFSSQGFLFSSGQKTIGCFWNICAGDGQEKIEEILKKAGYIDIQESVSDKCMWVQLSKPSKVLYANDPSWRRGQVCIVLTDGRATEIVWSSNALAP